MPLLLCVSCTFIGTEKLICRVNKYLNIQVRVLCFHNLSVWQVTLLKDLVVKTLQGKQENYTPLFTFIIQCAKVPSVLPAPCLAFCYE